MTKTKIGNQWFGRDCTGGRFAVGDHIRFSPKGWPRRSHTGQTPEQAAHNQWPFYPTSDVPYEGFESYSQQVMNDSIVGVVVKVFGPPYLVPTSANRDGWMMEHPWADLTYHRTDDRIDIDSPAWFSQQYVLNSMGARGWGTPPGEFPKEFRSAWAGPRVHSGRITPVAETKNTARGDWSRKFCAYEIMLETDAGKRPHLVWDWQLMPVLFDRLKWVVKK